MTPAPLFGGLLGAPAPELVLLALLLAGHLVADFALQTRRMVRGKGQLSGLLAHTGVVALTHLAALLPVMSVALAVSALGVAVIHGILDRLKIHAARAGASDLAAFLLDQAAHVAIVVGAWFVLVRIGATPSAPSLEVRLWSAAWMGVGVFAFAWSGGSALVSGTLTLLGPHLEELEDRGEPGDQGLAGSGRMIGILERSLSLLFMLAGEWAGVALLVTAKSVARFEALKKRPFAEYYLVGTLTSLLVAVLAGVALALFLWGSPFRP